MLPTDCYKLLEIPPDADENTIRKAFRLKTKTTHPDVNDSMDAALEFMKLKEAMELLLDPTRRLQHDRQFGYFSKPKNKDSNAKEKFSAFQKTKAENLVNSWEQDNVKAMQMRMEQNKAVVDRYRRMVKIFLFVIVMVMMMAIGVLVFLKAR